MNNLIDWERISDVEFLKELKTRIERKVIGFQPKGCWFKTKGIPKDSEDYHEFNYWHALYGDDGWVPKEKVKRYKKPKPSVEELTKLREENKTAKEIALHYKVSARTVVNWLKKNNMPRKRVIFERQHFCSSCKGKEFSDEEWKKHIKEATKERRKLLEAERKSNKIIEN